jgi:elongation factor G
VETVAMVVNAINGIEHGTRRMMAHAKQRGWRACW